MISSRTDVLRSAILPALLATISLSSLYGQVSVLTNRNDNGRTGLNANETFLNPSNVNQATFAKLGAFNVDGYVVAQPLYVPNVSISGTLRNVVFVVTQHDSVYAFDADSVAGGAPLWQVNFLNAAAGISTVPISEQGCAAVNGYTEMGIQGTPVIDNNTGTLYVSVKTKEVSGGSTAYIHRLHALDITNGQEKFGGPVQVTGSVQSAHGTVTFDSPKSCQRPGLLLSNGIVYLAYGSNGCDTNHGWVFAYDATNLSQVGVFNTSPNQTRGAGIWQGGAGLAGDESGHIFFLTANGAFNVNTGGLDIGDSFVKLNHGANSLTLNDYFTPFDQATMNANDLDLGSGGLMLLTNLGQPHPSILIGAGKTGTPYVVDPNNMGGFNSSNNSQIIQWLQSVMNEVDGTPAYWNSTVFFAPDHAPAVSYGLSGGKLSNTPLAMTQPIIPAGAPSVSANGNSNGIVWLVRAFGSAQQLSAFDAVSMVELYNSSQAGTRDSLGSTPHFVVPTVANGKVFVGTQTQLVVYGLMPALSSNSGGGQTGVAGSTLPAPLTIKATNPYTGAPLAGVTVTFSGSGTFGNPTPVTDSTGTASTTYTLPTTFTNSTLTVTVAAAGYTSTTFTETVTPGNPAKVVYVSGGSQTGTVGTTLPKAIVFKVTDQYGNITPGVSVTLSDSPNHGVLLPNPATTDSAGKVTVTYTLPTKAGYNTVTAIAGTGNASVQERGVAGAAAALSIISGNNQTGAGGTTLPKQQVVKVSDQYGNGVSGVTVTYSDNGAGGSFSSTTVTTGTNGQAGVSYTTPTTTGMITITASVNGLTPVTFKVKVI